MPDPKKYKDKNKFMSDCISEVMDEGKDHDQAVGQCSGMWKNKEKKMSHSKKETRVLPMTEFRVLKEDGKSTLEGYAARFGKWSEDLGGFREKIKPGAFKKALGNSDVRALFNHDANYVLGRSTAGTLKLAEDGKGLLMINDPPDTQWAKDLMISVDRGDITQMSFGFTVEDEEWNKDFNERTINKIGRLFDVSVVTYPAYPDTTVALRSIEENKKVEKPKFEIVEEPDEERRLTSEEIKEIVSEIVHKTFEAIALESKATVEENAEGEPMQAESEKEKSEGDSEPMQGEVKDFLNEKFKKHDMEIFIK